MLSPLDRDRLAGLVCDTATATCLSASRSPDSLNRKSCPTLAPTPCAWASALRRRPLPIRALNFVELLALALLAALVVVETFGKGHSLTLGGRRSSSLCSAQRP